MQEGVTGHSFPDTKPKSRYIVALSRVGSGGGNLLTSISDLKNEKKVTNDLRLSGRQVTDGEL